MSRHQPHTPRYRNRRQKGPEARRRMGIIFAVAFGWVGVHRFTLGQWQYGLLHVFLFVVSMSALGGTPFGRTPWLTVSALLAYYTAFRWFNMSDGEFADRYLEPADGDDGEVPGRYLNGRTAPHPKVLSRRARRKLLATAAERYGGFDYQGAAEVYEEALDLDLSDGESRVLAARCYSLLEDADAAYRHLRKAVHLRADNLDLVKLDEGFAWLRSRADFAARMRRGFAAEPAAPTDAPAAGEPGALPPPTRATILDHLERLGELRERGLLDDEEFAREKRRLLE